MCGNENAARTCHFLGIRRSKSSNMPRVSEEVKTVTVPLFWKHPLARMQIEKFPRLAL
jgi:hypothetical protein